jgi:hypothetical protein
MGRDEGILGKVVDSARKTEQAEASGNRADQKAAEASYDDMVEAASDAGLLDDD